MDMDDLEKLLRSLGMKSSHFREPSEIKEAPDVGCNCPWLECTVHSGSLCNNNAVTVAKCGLFCTEGPHYLGDGTLGEGIHLCSPCGEALVEIFASEVPALMQDFTKYMPDWMKLLENMCRVAYSAPIDQKTHWVLPQIDAIAVLTLAFITTHVDAKGQFSVRSSPHVPDELKARLLLLKCKIESMSRAFLMDGKEVKVSE